MSKSSQRKNNVVAEGRKHALQGGSREHNPYRGGPKRRFWLEGWEVGSVALFRVRRVAKRTEREKSRFWRWIFCITDLFDPESRQPSKKRTAQTPARRRGMW
jgi:ribosome modulation factor